MRIKSDTIYQKRILDPNVLSLVRHNIHQRGQALVLFCRLLRYHQNWHKEFDKLYKNFVAWMPQTEFLKNKTIADFKFFLDKKGLSEYFGYYFGILSAWPERMPQDEARKKMLKIALEIEKNQWSLKNPNPKLQKTLDNFVKKYGWLKYTKKRLTAELQEILPKNILAELRNFRNSTNQIFIQREELTDKLNLSLSLKKELDVLAELLYLEKYSQNILWQADYNIKNLPK